MIFTRSTASAPDSVSLVVTAAMFTAATADVTATASHEQRQEACVENLSRRCHITRRMTLNKRSVFFSAIPNCLQSNSLWARGV